jgi:two-component system, cell cycle sensor histidine kinase and response regulator CckA
VSTKSPQEETVLVVEDHDNVRETIARRLREDGYRVIEASDGRLALTVLASGRRIDLLVTDMVMPHMGGLELAQVVKWIRHPPILLFMSAYDFEPSTVPGPLLRKPVRPSELVAEVRRLLAAA